ncbi:ComEC/Rec2 family competence protein [Sulfitobacter sp. PR48]|uniref:ComEC/Rec2 family competence protein n=1 Tax=Sulfitobacter sp. PR48 TaxID=3028383 RepID=UPI00237B4966|nr:ComEC/Rec2 family competence protein [Sulfitobacter sp. PR48]MDD9721372.1 ComEC/Rec2 family competence protein [Sulfitobacter sp. PR48]
MGLCGRISNSAGKVLLAQRGGLICWVPVCLAAGVGSYFSLATEPDLPVLAGLAATALLMLVLARFLPEPVAPLALGTALCLIGVLLAAGRAHRVAGPVLGWRYYGPVEGRIVAMDRSQSDALRLTLDQVRLARVSPARTPDRVRLSLHGGAGITPEPGLRVMTTAHLSPPAGPVEPGGFDFQRHAWFARLGAVGYTRVPLLGVAEARDGHAGLAVFRIRMAASARIRQVLPGDIGGFAAAITTGDRSAISREALEALRASNLAHLLAISGLHMGLLSAVVLGALRLLLAAHPVTALRWPAKGIAAGGALIAAAGYLALSGGNVATERAFIMVGVALGALMIGRRALSLRAVAIAATLVLILRPEALTGPGFQMSFAATTALVAVFGWLRAVDMGWLPPWLKPAFAVFVSSAVAGLATAPIAAAHFNTIAHYGLIANLVSVPLMGVLIIPAAVAALVLAPFGAEALGLWVMGLGLRWILGVAHWIAGLEGARGYVVGPGGWVIPLLALGFLLLILWQGRLRLAGLPVMALALVLWQGAQRPAVLISDTGALVGVMTPQGRALSRERTAGFVARNWLENDGDGGGQLEAALRWPEGGKVIHLSGKRRLAAFEGCAPGQIVVVSVPAADLAQAPCDVFDPLLLKHTGALALTPGKQGWTLTTARERTGDRLWTHWPPAKPEAAPDQYVRISPTRRP